MLQSDEAIEIFMKLGLTHLQAKTYLTLAKLGTAEASEIAKSSNIARQDIYRIMPTLQELRLAEKVIANPIMFKATPWKRGISMLLEQRTEEHTELEKRTKDLFENFAEDEQITPIGEGQTSQFIITSEKNLFLKRMETAISEAKISKDIIVTFEGFNTLLYNHLHLLKKAQKRGLKIRVITEKSKEKLSINPQELKPEPPFEIRYVSDSVPVTLVIYDHQEANIRISNEAIVPSLWTNNNSLVKLAEIYFEDMWKTAEPS